MPKRKMTAIQSGDVSNTLTKKSAAPQLAIEYVPLAELVPYARNARTHTDEQIAQIAASLREFGWTNPVLVDEQRTIIAGHGRVLAAQKLKLTDAPCITLPNLSEAQRRAYIIVDNKLALNAGWDNDLLGAELLALQELGGDLTLLGFNDVELARLLAPYENIGNESAQLANGFTYKLIVDCKDERVQGELMTRLEAEGFTCKPLVS